MRIGAALALTIGMLAVASPAQAHPTVNPPRCETGAGHITCTVSFSGAIPPVDIKWYFDGVHFANCDDRIWCSAGCPIGTRVSVKVVVTDASNVAVTKGANPVCLRDPQ